MTWGDGDGTGGQIVLPLTLTLVKVTLSAFFTLIVELSMLVNVLLLTDTFLMWLAESPLSLRKRN